MKKIFLLLIVTLIFVTRLIAQFDYRSEKDKNNHRDSLKQQIKIAVQDTVKIKLLIKLSEDYIFLDGDSAAYFAKKALALSKQSGVKKGEVIAYAELCQSYTLLGDYSAALDFGFKASALSQSLGDIGLIRGCHYCLTLCYFQQENYAKALEYAREELQYYKAIKSTQKNKYWASFGLIGSIYERNNIPDSALYYEFQAQNAVKGWSGNYLAIGDAYQKKGKIDSALFYYRHGLPFAVETGIYIDVVDISNAMSRAFENRGQLDSALYYAHKSVVYKISLKYPRGQLMAARQVAHLYELKGIRDSTIKYLKLSMTLNEQLFGKEKTRQAQSYAFNQQIQEQELAAQQVANENRIKMYGLIAVIVVAVLGAITFYRNSRHRQKANIVLAKTLSDLKATQTQLIQSEKMASLGELTAGIAHEIQNPLNFVNNFSEVNKEMIEELEDELKSGNIDDALLIAADIKQNEEKINHHGKRADAIVKGMLEHSRAGSGTKEPTDINKLADEYLRLSYHGLRAKDKTFNAEMVTNFDENLPLINVIPQDIGRVLLNLFNNAFYAVNQRAKIAGADYNPTVVVETFYLPSLGVGGLKVKDNGTGIPDAIKDKIMQPFFTTKPTGEGTGLGLSLTYDMVVKGHGGRIELNSKQGVGAEFIVLLPANI